MHGFEFESQPPLRDPVAVFAFAGWNDAASAATNAARFLISRLGAKRFATLPAEGFFDFRATRPTVKLKPSGDRTLAWPSLELFSARGAGSSDLVVGLGSEPSLRWNSFSTCIVDLLVEAGTRLTVTLGALLSDTPHSRPVRVTGSAPDEATAEALGLSTSRYEGPTGIVGVFNQALHRRGLRAASIWANCPHYVSTNQNPPATAALIERLSPLIGITFDLTDLERASERFVREVDAAVATNPEIADYVRQLESAVDEDTDVSPTPPDVSEQLFHDIEQFLRENGSGDDY